MESTQSGISSQNENDIQSSVEKPEDKKAKKNSIFTINNFAKVVAFFTVFTGTFGLCYQKGLIDAMGLGNISGNYSVEEIFYSAFIGYIAILEKIIEVGLLDMIYEFYGRNLITLVLAASVIFILFKYRDEIKDWVGNAKSNSIKTASNLSGKVQLLLTWLGAAVVATLVTIVQAMWMYVVLLVGFVFLFPAFFGYQAGWNKANVMRESPVCIPHSEYKGDAKFIRQCTHIVINGQKLVGRVLLENSSGYFMRLNSGFIFTSKDGSICAFAKDEMLDGLNLKTFEFAKGQIDKFCQIVEN